MEPMMLHISEAVRSTNDDVMSLHDDDIEFYINVFKAVYGCKPRNFSFNSVEEYIHECDLLIQSSEWITQDESTYNDPEWLVKYFEGINDNVMHYEYIF